MNPKSNSAGRPTNKNIIKFSQQPRSTVSLFLLKERQKDIGKREICYDELSYTKFTLENASISKVKHNLDEPGKSCSVPYDLDVNEDYQKPLEEPVPRISLCNDGDLQQSDELNHPEILQINKEERQINRENYNTVGGMKIFSCFYPHCTYNTTNSSNMSKHKRIHSHNKLYLCDQCTFSTKFSNSLNVHKRLHTQEKPFICPNCDYKCNSSSNLKKHFNHRHQSLTA